MPNMFGGDQLSEDYAPWAYNDKGEFVGSNREQKEQPVEDNTIEFNSRIVPKGNGSFDLFIDDEFIGNSKNIQHLTSVYVLALENMTR
jgi:hypothetical protein